MKRFEMFDGTVLQVGDVVVFYDIWYGKSGDIDEILDSGCVWVGNNDSGLSVIAEFTIVNFEASVSEFSKVRIIDFY